MDMQYEENEKTCESMIEENNRWIDVFRAELREQGLSSKTIQRHVTNVDFFFNHYLARLNGCSAEEATSYLDDFMGDFFVHKCMWSTPETIKSTAASIKKFYKCLLQNQRISKECYREFCDVIKGNMYFWQAACADFNGDVDW